MQALYEMIKEILFLTGRVSPVSTFPEPLSKEEEAEAIKAYCTEGDEQARTKLIEHNLRLVAHIAKKYSKGSTDKDDIISLGTIGLIKGVTSFNPEKGSLVSYISRCIENEILMQLRREKKRLQYEVSLNEPIGRDSEGNEVTLVDRLGGGNDDITDEICKKALRDKIQSVSSRVLSDRERAVLTLRYNLDGEKPLAQREVAKLLDVSRSYVSRIERKALNKLASHFSNDYE